MDGNAGIEVCVGMAETDAELISRSPMSESTPDVLFSTLIFVSPSL